MALAIEHTDTFGGEANYCWVRRAYIKDDKLTRRQIVRKVKQWAGFTGHKCRVDDFGDDMAIYPNGVCQVIFVSYAEPEQLEHARENEIID